MGSIERAIRVPEAFDPRSYEGAFRIGMCDNLETAFFGPLAARIRREAPRARLVSVAAHTRHAEQQLDDGEFDISVSVHLEPASWHIRQPLFDQCSISIYDPDQLKLKAPLSLDDFSREAHIAVSFEGDMSGDVDAALKRVGRSRSVVATVPRYSALPTALSAMPAIATIPESIARCMASLHGLAISPSPVALEAAPVSLLYRRVDRADGRSQWFRRVFVEVAAEALRTSGCSCGIAEAA